MAQGRARGTSLLTSLGIALLLTACGGRGSTSTGSSPSATSTGTACSDPSVSPLAAPTSSADSAPRSVAEPIYFLADDGLYVSTADGRWMWRITDAAEGRYLASSPDGRTLAFQCSAVPSSVANDELPCVLGPDGSALPECRPSLSSERPRVVCLYSAHRRELLELSAARDLIAGCLSWSADGELLSFVGRDPGLGWHAIYAVGRDGSRVRQLTAGDAESIDPTWSPDGEWLALARWVDRGEYPVSHEVFAIGTACIYQAEGCTADQWTDQGAARWPSWSHDGRWLAFPCAQSTEPGWSLCLGGARGADASRVAEGVSAILPAWSPDDRWIAFGCADSSLCLLNVATRQITRMQVEGGGVNWVVWSRDGTRLAFTAWDERHDTDVFVARLDGTGPANVTRTAGISEWSVTWGPPIRTEGLELRRPGEAG
jgi:Tol biopolymer transport system component